MSGQKLKAQEAERSALNPEIFLGSPRINKKSQNMPRQEPTYEHLYKQSLQKDVKQMRLVNKVYEENGYTFTPKTNKWSGKKRPGNRDEQREDGSEKAMGRSASDIRLSWNIYQQQFRQADPDGSSK